MSVLRSFFIALSHHRTLRRFCEASSLGVKLSSRFVAGKEITELPNAKVHMRRLNRGVAVTIRAGGGGGFGPPHEREPERVLHDVREGYVSIDAAAEKYGVVIDPHTLEIIQVRRGK